MFNEREKKLVRLALDPSARGNEIHTSAVMLITSLRTRGITADAMLGFQPKQQQQQHAKRFVFPEWGKHNGKPFDEIPRDYFYWLLRKWFPNLDDEGSAQWQWLRDEIVEYLQ